MFTCPRPPAAPCELAPASSCRISPPAVRVWQTTFPRSCALSPAGLLRRAHREPGYYDVVHRTTGYPSRSSFWPESAGWPLVLRLTPGQVKTPARRGGPRSRVPGCSARISVPSPTAWANTAPRQSIRRALRCRSDPDRHRPPASTWSAHAGTPGGGQAERACPGLPSRLRRPHPAAHGAGRLLRAAARLRREPPCAPGCGCSRGVPFGSVLADPPPCTTRRRARDLDHSCSPTQGGAAGRVFAPPMCLPCPATLVLRLVALEHQAAEPVVARGGWSAVAVPTECHFSWFASIARPTAVLSPMVALRPGRREELARATGHARLSPGASTSRFCGSTRRCGGLPADVLRPRGGGIPARHVGAVTRSRVHCRGAERGGCV